MSKNQEIIYRKLVESGMMDKEELRFCIEQFRVNPVFKKYNNLFQVIEAIGYLTKEQINKVITELKAEMHFKKNAHDNTKRSEIYKNASATPPPSVLESDLNVPSSADEKSKASKILSAADKKSKATRLHSDSSTNVRSMDSILYPGGIIRGCKLIRKIGEGSMGQVWLGEHLSLKVEVAIKILHPEYYSNKTLLERFYREAHQVAKLDHQNIVRVYDVAEDEGSHLIIMQFIDGPSLAELEKEKQVGFE